MRAIDRIGVVAVAAVMLAAGGCQRETRIQGTTPTGTAAGAPQRVVMGPGGTIPAGTTVWLDLADRLSARENQVGDRFSATVSQDVLAQDGQLLMPRGARVTGRIVQLEESSRAGDEAVIGLAFDSIEMGGVDQPFQASVVETDVGAGRADIRGRDVLAGAAVGAVLGAIAEGTKGAIVGGALGAGAGTLISLGRGDVPAELPAGTQMQARIDSPVRSLAAIRGPAGRPY